MLNSFFLSFKLKNTYQVNSIIYSLKGLFLIGKRLPDHLYENKGLKLFGNIIHFFIELASIFLGKFLYLFLLVLFILHFYEQDQVNAFFHLFTFLTLCGGFLNTYMFNPTKDKYYAIVFMHMDARKFTLSNYYYSLLKVLLGFFPFSLLFSLFTKIPFWMTFFIPLFVVLVKMNVTSYTLYRFEKNGRVPNENLPPKVVWSLIILFLILGFGFPFLGFTMNTNSFLLFFFLNFFFGIYSFFKIHSFKHYEKLYKKVLTEENVYGIKEKASTEVLKENVSKQITYDPKVISNKSGFSYFHELFVKRHKKILTEAVLKQAVILFFLFLLLLVLVFVNKEVSKGINKILLESLPYFVFFLYFLNRGTTLTQAMFMNCDHSMLTYRMYRTPNVILGLFKERLKTLIFLNLVPALVIAVFLPILLFVTGGTDNLFNYVCLFVTIISISIFFSVHYLVMYYLLQPYNISTELKSSSYKVIQSFTYFVCYYMTDLNLPTISFGICMVLFSIFYSCFSLFLVYKYAPRTFKIRF